MSENASIRACRSARTYWVIRGYVHHVFVSVRRRCGGRRSFPILFWSRNSLDIHRIRDRDSVFSRDDVRDGQGRDVACASYPEETRTWMDDNNFGSPPSLLQITESQKHTSKDTARVTNLCRSGRPSLVQSDPRPVCANGISRPQRLRLGLLVGRPHMLGVQAVDDTVSTYVATSSHGSSN